MYLRDIGMCVVCVCVCVCVHIYIYIKKKKKKKEGQRRIVELDTKGTKKSTTLSNKINCSRVFTNVR